MSTFTMTQVICFGAERLWKPLGKRAFKDFREQFALPRPASASEGIQQATAFGAAYDYLAEAGEAERFRVATMLDQDAAWSEVKTLMRAKELERERAKEAERDEARRTTESLIEANRGRRSWRLCGTYLEDRTMAKYTLSELEAWRDWAAYFRFDRLVFGLSVECVDTDEQPLVAIDWTDAFADCCGNPKRFDFEAICQDLYKYTQERRALASPNN